MHQAWGLRNDRSYVKVVPYRMFASPAKKLSAQILRFLQEHPGDLALADLVQRQNALIPAPLLHVVQRSKKDDGEIDWEQVDARILAAVKSGVQTGALENPRKLVKQSQNGNEVLPILQLLAVQLRTEAQEEEGDSVPEARAGPTHRFRSDQWKLSVDITELEEGSLVAKVEGVGERPIWVSLSSHRGNLVGEAAGISLELDRVSLRCTVLAKEQSYEMTVSASDSEASLRKVLETNFKSDLQARISEGAQSGCSPTLVAAFDVVRALEEGPWSSTFTFLDFVAKQPTLSDAEAATVPLLYAWVTAARGGLGSDQCLLGHEFPTHHRARSSCRGGQADPEHRPAQLF